MQPVSVLAGVLVGRGVCVDVAVGAAVGAGVAVDVAVDVGNGLGVGYGVAVAVAVCVGVTVGVGVAVGSRIGANTSAGSGVAVAVAVGVGIGVTVGSGVYVGVGGLVGGAGVVQAMATAVAAQSPRAAITICARVFMACVSLQHVGRVGLTGMRKIGRIELGWVPGASVSVPWERVVRNLEDRESRLHVDGKQVVEFINCDVKGLLECGLPRDAGAAVLEESDQSADADAGC